MNKVILKRAAGVVLMLFICGACKTTTVDSDPPPESEGATEAIAKRLPVSEIYDLEAKHHPLSSWRYLGSDADWHYFEHSCLLNWQFGIHYKLKRKALPRIVGYKYEPNDSTRRPVSVKIFEDHIWLHIEGERPARLRYRSKGFLTDGSGNESGDGEPFVEPKYAVPPKP